MANFEKSINYVKIPGTTSIELPPFEDTGHVTHMSRGSREQIPEIGNPRAAIGLSQTAIRNVDMFTEQVLNLQPGQNAQVDMNTLSSFRYADFYSWIGKDTARGAFETLGTFGDDTLTLTNIDSYNAVVDKLQIPGVPSYQDLLKGHNAWRGDGWDFMTQEYELATRSLRALFYMRGDLPDSEIDDTPEHFLGIAVYAPSLE